MAVESVHGENGKGIGGGPIVGDQLRLGGRVNFRQKVNDHRHVLLVTVPGLVAVLRLVSGLVLFSALRWNS